MTARPCPGPHRCREPGHARAADPGCSTCPPVTSEPLCGSCRRKLVDWLGRLPEAYIEAYLALERGQRYDVRAEAEHGGSRPRKGSHAPIPVDVEADALMGRILEVVLSWHEVVTEAASLQDWARKASSRAVGGSTPATQGEETRNRDPSRRHVVYSASSVIRSDPDLRPGEPSTLRRHVLRPVGEIERVMDRASDSTSGVAITTACSTLAAHVGTLLGLPTTSVARTVTPGRVLAREHDRRFAGRADGPPDVVSLGRPLLPDDTEGHVLADGRAIAMTDLDGVGAALELFALERDVRRTLGWSRGAVVFDRPCPNPVCGQRSLVLLAGDDEVVCRDCGESWASSDYDRLSAVLNSETKGRAS